MFVSMFRPMHWPSYSDANWRVGANIDSTSHSNRRPASSHRKRSSSATGCRSQWISERFGLKFETYDQWIKSGAQFPCSVRVLKLCENRIKVMLRRSVTTLAVLLLGAIALQGT
jgi:hypothetical protein